MKGDIAFGIIVGVLAVIGIMVAPVFIFLLARLLIF